MAELGKLLGPRVTLQRPPEGTYGIPQVEHVAPPLSPNQLYEVGQTLCCPTEGHIQTKVPGCQVERVDIGVHGPANTRVSACRYPARNQALI